MQQELENLFQCPSCDKYFVETEDGISKLVIHKIFAHGEELNETDPNLTQDIPTELHNYRHYG